MKSTFCIEQLHAGKKIKIVEQREKILNWNSFISEIHSLLTLLGTAIHLLIHATIQSRSGASLRGATEKSVVGKLQVQILTMPQPSGWESREQN